MRSPAEGVAVTVPGRTARVAATKARVADVALTLFLRDGFDATTVDAIAAGAGISRRSFFSYFKTKDDVVSEWQAQSWEMLLAELRTVSPDESPMEAVRALMTKQSAMIEGEAMRRLDELMLASETLRARKPAVYARQEQSLYETLCEVWRQPERRLRLRLVAMLCLGAMRVAIETWRAEQGARAPADVINAVFDALPSVL